MAGARRGPAPKPLEVKRATGNPGHQRLPRSNITALAPVVHVSTDPPANTGREYVQRFLDAGASAWIGVTDQAATLDLVAQAWDERRDLRRFLALEGYSDLFGKERPEMKRLGVVEKQLTTWLSLLGLTTTDRSRLGVAEVKVRTKLEELRERRESRAGRLAGSRPSRPRTLPEATEATS